MPSIVVGTARVISHMQRGRRVYSFNEQTVSVDVKLQMMARMMSPGLQFANSFQNNQQQLAVGFFYV